MLPKSTPQQYYWSHNLSAMFKSYRKFKDAAPNSTNITNPMHQSLHAQIATSLTRLCCVISLHQSRDSLQRSANFDCEVILHVQFFCSQFSWYHELHSPIAARTNRHIPHPTVPCDKPWIRIRLLTLLRLQLAMGTNLLGWIMIEARQ